jgi:hypothetical protein
VRPAVFCCLSAAGVRFLDTLSCQTGFRPHYCRPTAGTTHTRECAADPGRVYTFRTHETRTGFPPWQHWLRQDELLKHCPMRAS